MNHGLLNVVEKFNKKPKVVAPVVNPSNATNFKVNFDDIRE
jgi:hypothetical protein